MIYKDIHAFLENYDRDNVIFCFGNNAVVNFVSNLMFSAEKVGLPVVLFALDKKISDTLGDKYDVVNYFNLDIEQDRFYEYGTEVFKKIVWHRFFIGLEILKSDRSYIYMDVDIVVCKNFETEILDKLFSFEEIDCVMQSFKLFPLKKDFVCSGFFAMKSTERTLGITLEFFEKNNYKEYRDDETFFNKVIFKKKVLNISQLNINAYPTGPTYYINYAEIRNTCRIVHFNGVVGYDAKIAKMKEFNLYNYEKS